MLLVVKYLWLSGLFFFESRKLPSSSRLLLAAVIITFPVFWSGFTGPAELLAAVIISLLWLSARYFKDRRIRLLLLLVCALAIAYFSLLLNGLISSGLKPDWERTFISDSRFSFFIQRFSDWSVYLPFRLRPVVFSSWIIIVNVFGRAISWFWFDQVIPVIGFLALVPLGLGIFRRHPAAPLALIFVSAAAGSLSRNPNTAAIFSLVLPQLLTLIRLGLPAPSHE